MVVGPTHLARRVVSLVSTHDRDWARSAAYGTWRHLVTQWQGPRIPVSPAHESNKTRKDFPILSLTSWPFPPALFRPLPSTSSILRPVAHSFMFHPHSKEALRSVVISQRLLGTREIAIFHHTGCGMVTFDTPTLRDIVKESAPGDAELAQAVDDIDFLEFKHLEESVKEDVRFLQENPLVLPGTKVTGWVYEVETGKVRATSLGKPCISQQAFLSWYRSAS